MYSQCNDVYFDTCLLEGKKEIHCIYVVRDTCKCCHTCIFIFFCLNKLPVLARCQATGLLIVARFVVYTCFFILAITPEDFAAACEECILCSIMFFFIFNKKVQHGFFSLSA